VRALGLLIVSLLVALAAPAGASAYGWPIKPFDRQHPIRGFFGDPRTVFENGVLAGAFDGPSILSFHQGIDIVAPNGTPIYPVESGTAHYLGAATLNIDTGDDVVFQYFHILPIVGEGQAVIARKTILGYVQAPYGHVHLTEIDGARTVDGAHAVNPLARGHLAPYVDHTRPTIRDASFRNQSGLIQTPLGLCGRVEIDVDAFDMPPVPIPGRFNGLPVAPALVRWTITRLNGKPVVPWRTSADFRGGVPGNKQFPDVYAKGTYENAPRFGAQQYAAMPGRYLFLLAGNYDTATLPNGVYVLGVRVADIRGNQASLAERFSVLNAHKGVCPGTLPAPSATLPPSEPPDDGSGDGS
jgi:hypothetical protein